MKPSQGQSTSVACLLKTSYIDGESPVKGQTDCFNRAPHLHDLYLFDGEKNTSSPKDVPLYP